MKRVIKCRNTASGQVLLTGVNTLPQTLLDTVSLLVSIPDLTMRAPCRFIYDMVEIEFVGANHFSIPDQVGAYIEDECKVLVSAYKIALLLATKWVSNLRTNNSFAVEATHYLLRTILHEALHSHLHRYFVDPVEEESKVASLTGQLYLAFIETYGLEFEATTLMHGLTAIELAGTSAGRKIIEKQNDWIINSIVSTTNDGGAFLSISEEYRCRFLPHTKWRQVQPNAAVALAKLLDEDKTTSEEVMALAPPVEAVVEDEVQPPMIQATIVPNPPIPEPPEVPLPPLEIYNEYADDSRVVACTTNENTNLAKAIAASPAYSSTVPYVATKTMEQSIIEVGKAISAHLFLECGWKPDSETGFTNAEGVFKDIDLDTPEGLVRSYDTTNDKGVRITLPFGGVIRGQIFKHTKLPAYSLVFDDGRRQFKRLFIPQNINKRKVSGELSYFAIKARGGDRIVWVIDEEINNHSVLEARRAGARATKFVGKYVDGVYTTIAKGGEE